MCITSYIIDSNLLMFIWQSPNLVGCPIGILQLVLYCKYRNNGVSEEPAKWELEKNSNNINNNINDDDKTKQLQPVIDDININGKC